MAPQAPRQPKSSQIFAALEGKYRSTRRPGAACARGNLGVMRYLYGGEGPFIHATMAEITEENRPGAFPGEARGGIDVGSRGSLVPSPCRAESKLPRERLTNGLLPESSSSGSRGCRGTSWGFRETFSKELALEPDETGVPESAGIIAVSLVRQGRRDVSFPSPRSAKPLSNRMF